MTNEDQIAPCLPRRTRFRPWTCSTLSNRWTWIASKSDPRGAEG